MTEPITLAISAFRSDSEVCALLKSIFAAPHSEVDRVVVVDSCGSGEIARTAEENGWPIHYENSDVNLGSAGNLARRLELAMEARAKWCLCLNHDASWDADRLSAMLKVARSRQRVGAVYPMLDHSPREPRWEDGRRNFRPSAGARLSSIPTDEAAAEVLWSSSNFALYSTTPLLEGIGVMKELWMGYEDLAYGISLNRGGWIQLSCRSAWLSQAFDYSARRFLGRTVYIPEKPSWYGYYNIRNLILIRRRYGSHGVQRRFIITKLLTSGLRITLFEDEILMRLRLLWSGVIAGLLGKSGKGRFP
jgi:GT2 family glycosyltransferase